MCRCEMYYTRCTLNGGDWKHAEEIFPDAAMRLSPRESPEWYSKVAVRAARADAKTNAIRMWTQVANLSPLHIDGMGHFGATYFIPPVIAPTLFSNPRRYFCVASKERNE